ncbi:M56 family metallopeptidase [Myroides odoratus]|uniref:M56 family metallopeptidase n=1 Tax=Myroides odoratus TaxID=256 RepID=UPI0039B0DC92
MTPFFEYILKVNGLLLLVLGFYLLLLKKETFFTTIRYFFIAGIVCSLIFPLLTFTKIVYVEQSIDWAMLMNQDTVGGSKGIHQTLIDQLGVSGIVTFAFVLITGAIGIFFMFKIRRLMRYIKHLQGFSDSDVTIKVDRNSEEAYSFWKWIVLPVNYRKIEALDMIIQHEKVHVQEKHTLDLVLIHFLRCIFWFNPFLVLLEKYIRLNLEYIVDQKVIELQNSYEYQITLVQFEQLKASNISLVNSFKSSDLKKRIVMLNQPKSNYMKKSKFVLCLPIAIGFILLFQVKTKAEVRFLDQETTTHSNTVQEPKNNKKNSGFLSSNEGQEDSKKVAEDSKRVIEDSKRVTEDSKKVIEDSKKIREDSERVIEDSNKAKEHSKKAMEDSKKAMEDSKKAKEDSKKAMEDSKKALDAAAKARKQAKIAEEKARANQTSDKNLNYRSSSVSQMSASNPIYVVDGKKVKDPATISAIISENIERVDVLKGEQAIKEYGKEGENGVIEITKKK